MQVPLHSAGGITSGSSRFGRRAASRGCGRKGPTPHTALVPMAGGAVAGECPPGPRRQLGVKKHLMKRHLFYSSDSSPGIQRHVHGGEPSYRHPDGRPVRAPKTLDRIARLGIPPAWTEVWICGASRGHLQATGRDARHRKQYVYHADWTAQRDSNKFAALVKFAGVLPRIRRAIRRDLARGAPGKERVLAAAIQLMDKACIRVGHDRYRRENGSFGLTTLRERHVRASGTEVFLDFRGKSGKQHHIEVDDAQLARVVRDCLGLPGQQLFQYKDGDELRQICAQDVNEYLRRIAGVAITSKDFRTWGGTVCAASSLARASVPRTKSEARANVRDAIKAAAARLGNTPTVCRRSYIHPRVFECYEAGIVAAPARVSGLRKAECAVLGMLLGRRRPAAARPRSEARQTSKAKPSPKPAAVAPHALAA